jgi:TrkA domain protein
MSTGPDRRLLQPNVVEHSLPGIGHRYEMEAIEGGVVCVTIHHSGRRDVYVLPRGGGDPKAALTLTDAQARTLGAVLSGAYFKPAMVDEIDAVVGNLLIDWFMLDDASPGAGKSIADLAVRTETRMTIAAIVRGSDSIVAPEPSEVLQAGDQLVVIGRQEDLRIFVRHVVDADRSG